MCIIKLIRTSLGTSVSNSDFDLGYTGLKVEDFSLFEGGTLVLTWIFRLKWGGGPEFSFNVLL
jgi:hypothetical protein